MSDQKYVATELLKSHEQIFRRSVSLYLLATYSDGLIQRNCPHSESKAYIDKFITKFGASDFFTNVENDYLKNEDPSDEEIGVYCWRWEGLYFILWAMGFIEDLGKPTTGCNTFSCAKVFNRSRNFESFMKFARPRNAADVVAKANELESLAGSDEAKNFDNGVFTEWRRAASWLLTETEWDAIKLE